MEINKIKNKLIYFAARGEADPVKRNKNFKHSVFKKKIRILLSEIKIEFIEVKKFFQLSFTYIYYLNQESVTGKDLNNIGWQKKLPFGEVPCWGSKKKNFYK